MADETHPVNIGRDAAGAGPNATTALRHPGAEDPPPTALPGAPPARPKRSAREGGKTLSTFLGIPTAPRGVGHLRGDEPFPVAARKALANTQLRRNLGKAT
ncbi:MAG TPA: hypothetical protein VGF32_29210, partial [Streptosporangiaceae bacterium]